MNVSNVIRISAVLAIAAAVMGAVGIRAAQTAPGDPTIAQRPLTQTARIKPAFIMAVDDSGSMNWETLFANQDGTAFWGRDKSSSPYSFYADDGSLRSSGSGDFLELFPFPNRVTKRRAIPAVPNLGFARSHEFNPAYYNPGETYTPWANYDGTVQANANPANTRVDPRTGVYFDLTNDVADTDNNYRFYFAQGMTVPAGTTYYRRSGSCSFGGSNNSWNTLASDTVVGGDCNASVRYFPATYYLTTATSPDGNTGGTPVSQVGGPRAGATWATLYRYEIKPGNYGSPAQYSAAIQNFANWFQYFRNRNLAIIASMTQAYTGIDFMRVGYFTINNRATVNMRDMADNTAGGGRAQLYASITSLDANGGTPNRYAVDYIGTQFKRTDSGAPVQLACQVNAGMLFTDGYSNSGGPNVGNQDGAMGAPFADGFSNTMADIAAKYYNTNLRTDLQAGRVNVPTGCSSGTPDPKLDCNKNPHMNFYGITLGALGLNYGNPPYVDNPNTNGNEASDAAFVTPPNWSNDLDDRPEAVDAIWHATINSRGQFVNSQSPSSVRDAMRNILNRVNDASLGSGSIAGSGARVPGDNVAITVEPSFKVGNNGTDWTGELIGYRVNADGTLGAQAWTATGVLPSEPARTLVAMKTAGNAASRVAVNFKASSLGATLISQLAAIGLTPLKVAVSNFPLATPDDIVDYLRGKTTKEIRNGGQFRDRSEVLGDIVNSTPTISAPKDDYGWQGLAAPLDGYAAYLASKATRRPMVYVGANEGMLHAFDAETGVENFGFIPQAALVNMGDLPSKYYPHRFYVDGDPVVTDAKVGGAWKTVLVGTTAAGGRSIFALDVSAPGSFGTGNVMWERNSASDGDLGYTFGRPVVVPLESGSFGVIYGNGYGNDSNDPYLYVVDLATGNQIAKLRGNDGNTAYNGLGQIAVIDTDGNGKADTVYGGDLQGNVWKFNISSPTPASWSVAFGNTPLFTATDAGGKRQPITGDLDVAAGPSGGVSVFFGTGRYFADGDNLVPPSPDIQSLYGVTDTGTPIGMRANLVQQKITAENVTTLPSGAVARSRQTTRIPFNVAKRGFYMDLGVDGGSGPAAKGEMFIGNPRIQGGTVFFTTFEPLGDPCTPGGRNWLYGLDLASGGAALQNISIDSSGTPACTGDCGGLALGEGSPITDTSVFIPRPTPIPGLTCVAGSPGCPTPAPGSPPPLEQCTLVIRAPGSPPLFLPRPCGRQSWRQVR